MTISWRGWNRQLGLASWLVMGGVVVSSANCAYAQITPDNTLGNENSNENSTVWFNDAAAIWQRMVQSCQPSGNQAQSEFVVTGRGGLPPSPDETLSSDAIQVDWVTLNPKVENHNQGGSTNISTPEPNSMVEATGWTIAHNGDVLLTASATPALPANSWQTPAKCHAN